MEKISHEKIYFSHNGERKRSESAWTWICSCGREESFSTKAAAQLAWKRHLDKHTKIENS